MKSNKYLDELISYGGIPCTRAEAILDMQAMGLDQPCIDRWLQGYEHTQRLRERAARVPPASSSPRIPALGSSAAETLSSPPPPQNPPKPL